MSQFEEKVLSVVQLIATPLSLSGCKCHFHSVMFYTTKEFHRITAVSWHNVIIHGHFCIVLLLKILQLIKMWIASYGAQIITLVTRFRLPSEWQSHWYLANKKVYYNPAIYCYYPFFFCFTSREEGKAVVKRAKNNRSEQYCCHCP